MKNYRRVIAGMLAVLLSAGATGAFAYQRQNAPVSAEETAAEPDSGTEETERTPASGRAEKDETVYVMCNADASVKNVVVSDWLKNPKAAATLSDLSSLTGIENVKGDESFTQDGKALSWNASGDDIYYTGSSDAELPVGVTVTYLLDGKPISPEKLKGKSGHVTIRWDYENRTSVTKEIGGEKRQISVPFMAASAAVLDSSRFLNATITNGKIISDGNRLIVVGVAFPGLNDSLGLRDLKQIETELPESVELSADVTDFSLNTSVTVVSSEIFSDLHFDDAASFDDLTAKIHELSDGAESLCDGTAALYDGLTQLSDGTGDLTSGNSMTALRHCNPARIRSAAAQVRSAAAHRSLRMQHHRSRQAQRMQRTAPQSCSQDMSRSAAAQIP